MPDRKIRSLISAATRSPAIEVLILFAVLPYANALLNDFAYVYDDKAQILDNPYVHSFRYLRQIFATPVWSYAGAQAFTGYYRPMMTFGFLVCYRLFGPLAYGFHLANVLLHAAAVCLLYLVTLRLFRDRLLALVAAGLFALHPIHTEPVAWISGVTELEVTFFYLLTFWLFLWVAAPAGPPPGGRGIRQLTEKVASNGSGPACAGRPQGSRRRPWAQAAMLTSFVLTILSKEQAVTLPLLAAIYEHFYRKDRAETTWAQKLSRYGALWLITVGYAVVRLRFLGAFARPKAFHQLTWFQTTLSAVSLVGQYLWKLLWPVDLMAFHAYQRGLTLSDPHVLAGLAALVLCIVAFILFWKRARAVSFGVAWFLVTLAPVLNARWMGLYVFSERYLYLPSVGFCWVVAWAGTALWQRASRLPAQAGRRALERGAMIFGSGLLVALCAVRIFTRNRDWRDDVTLLSRTLAVEPKEARLHDGLGLAYWLRGEPEAAEAEWRAALRLDPSNSSTLNYLGMAYARNQRLGEAAKLFQAAISLEPSFARPHLNLGATYAQMGRMEDAERQLRAAVVLTPLDFEAHNLLGKLCFDSGRLREAEEQFRQSLDVEPNVAAYDYLGDIYLRAGARGQAKLAFEAALVLNASDSHAHFNLGLIYAAAGQNAEALRELRKALEADPGSPEVLSALQRLQRTIKAQ
jgi:tetratricopeptide (TPR) repeat protein